jgi:capsular polysaccharide transport system permease protein
MLAAVYFFVVAASQYETEARFVVRSAARPEVPGGLSILVQLGLARSQDDSFIVQEFMVSRDAIEKLRARLPLEAMFDREGADFLARYPSVIYGPEAEEFYRYFQRMMTVVHTDKTGISTLRVRAFHASDARDIAETLLQLGEEFVNRINQRLQVDAVGNSSAELGLAQARLIQAQTALTDFRNRELMVDPSRNAIALAELIAHLSAELGGTQAQIAEMKSGAAGNPQLLGLRRKATSLEEQIIRERSRIAGDSQGLAERIATYERLILEREFAQRMLGASEADLVRARSEAARQLLYLDRVVEPYLADYPTRPKRIADVMTILAANTLLLLIGWLFATGLREHAAAHK